MDPLYRITQFWQALTAQPLAPAAAAEIAQFLSPAEWALFKNFSHNDQVHSYKVFTTLKGDGVDEPALLTAALLHDIGKSRYKITVWERVLIVIGEWLVKEQTLVWGEGEAAGWRRPFVIKAQHPDWGAEMAAAAGATPLAVRLIARHQEPLPQIVTAEDAFLAKLQWADSQH